MLTITDTNPVPRLAALAPGNPGLLSFSLTGEGGRWYKIESSPDLTHWASPTWFQLTNATIPLAIPRLGPTHFVRASLNVPTDVCIAQLKQLRWGQCLWVIENRKSPTNLVTLSDMKPFIPLGPYNNIMPCLEGGFYAAVINIFSNPTCSLDSRGHKLTAP